MQRCALHVGGDHPVDATGPCQALRTMVPAVPPVILPTGELRYPLVFIYFLFLPIIHPGADIPDATMWVDFLVAVARCGVAFERCLLGGLDTSACTVSVARARLKRLGIRLFLADPAPFTAMFADLYPVTPTPALLGAPQPQAVPPAAAVALLIWMVANDDTFELLADAEVVVQPRVDPAERVAGQGFDFYFTPALAISDAQMPAALLALVPVIDRARSAIDLITLLRRSTRRKVGCRSLALSLFRVLVRRAATAAGSPPLRGSLPYCFPPTAAAWHSPGLRTLPLYPSGWAMWAIPVYGVCVRGATPPSPSLYMLPL